MSTTTAVSEVAGANETGNIDLMGWDTVFALTLDALNKSIVAQKKTPPSFEGTDSQGGASVSGTWGDWIVIGGEGTGIYIKCPVTKGTLTVPGMTPVSLDGGYVEVEITLTVNHSSTPMVDASAKPGTGVAKVFQANGSSEDPFQQPKVQNVSFQNVKGYIVYAAEAAFNDYFQKNIAVFDAVFSSVLLEEEAIEADKQWLKPQESLYAMAFAGNNAYFGVLNLTRKLNPGEALPQQNFDLRMFDFFQKTEVPTNSVFAIASTLAMRNIVMASAPLCVKNSTIDDFEIVNNGITVTNKNTLNWGDFQFDKDSKETVCPTITPGNFQLTLDGSQFHLSVSQASFTTPDGSCDVKITADQYFTFGVTKLEDGKYYFTPGDGLGTNSIRADVSANKEFQIAMIIESIVIGVALGFLGGAIGESLGDVVSSTTSSATEGVVEASEESIESGINSMTEEAIEEATSSAISEATESIATDGESVAAKSGLFANKFKIWGGVLGGMLAIPIGLLPQIMTAIYSGEITTGNVPTIDDFATNFTGAVQWPYVESWQVTGGTFASAFMLSGNAK